MFPALYLEMKYMVSDALPKNFSICFLSPFFIKSNFGNFYWLQKKGVG